MLFNFLIYLQPTHYFQLFRKDGTSAFPIVEKLPQEIVQNLDKDLDYESEFSKDYDLSWQAIQKGYIGEGETYTHFEKLPVQDEYRFLRKNFHWAWVFYVLSLRLLSFKNPLKEIAAYRKTKKLGRSFYHDKPFIYNDWDAFDSGLIREYPLVSVIIPTLNRYRYLKDVLEDLEKQDYTNFEVIIVDQSSPFQEDFYADFKLNKTLIHQEERALWLARNTAIETAKGDYILLFDDDSRIDPNWIQMHLKALDYFKADISSGVSISTVGAEVPQNYSYFHNSSQLDTGNVLLKKEVFRKLGLFDRQFERQRMGDGEFGLRAYLNGFLNISNPHAKRLHLKVGSGGLREMGSWDAFRPKNLLAPRPIPSVLYLYRKYFGGKRSVFALLKTVPPSIIPYRFKKSKKFLILGFIISVVLFPFVLLQVFISWRLASEKLKEGEMISELVK